MQARCSGFGLEPTLPRAAHARSELTKILEANAPAKVRNIPSQEYEGRELELLERVKAKYSIANWSVPRSQDRRVSDDMDAFKQIFYTHQGCGHDRAWPALRLNSQKGGLKFDHFPIGRFGSEKCSWQLRSAAARIRGRNQNAIWPVNPISSETKTPKLDHLELENSKKKQSHFESRKEVCMTII
jgi:hypothetical protein